MAEKKPLVLNNGQIEQLQSADTVAGGTSITGTAVMSFPAAGAQEDASKVTTVLNALITAANLKSVSFMPIVSADHDSLDDFAWDGLTFNIENIIDNVSFDIRATAPNGTWGDYNIKYLIAI